LPDEGGPDDVAPEARLLVIELRYRQAQLRQALPAAEPNDPHGGGQARLDQVAIAGAGPAELAATVEGWRVVDGELAAAGRDLRGFERQQRIADILLDRIAELAAVGTVVGDWQVDLDRGLATARAATSAEDATRIRMWLVVGLGATPAAGTPAYWQSVWMVFEELHRNRGAAGRAVAEFLPAVVGALSAEMHDRHDAGWAFLYAPGWLDEALTTSAGPSTWLPRFRRNALPKDILAVAAMVTAVSLRSRSAGWVAKLPKKRRSYARLMSVLRMWTDPQLFARYQRLILLGAALNVVEREKRSEYVAAWLVVIEHVISMDHSLDELGLRSAVARLLGDALSAAYAVVSPWTGQPVEQMRRLGARLGELAARAARAYAPPGSDLFDALVLYERSPELNRLFTVFENVLRKTNSRRAAEDAFWRTLGDTIRDEAPPDMATTISGIPVLVGVSTDPVEILHLGVGMARHGRGKEACNACLTGEHRNWAEHPLRHRRIAVLFIWKRTSRADAPGSTGPYRGEALAQVAIGANHDERLVPVDDLYAKRQVSAELVAGAGPAFSRYVWAWHQQSGRGLVRPLRTATQWFTLPGRGRRVRDYELYLPDDGISRMHFDVTGSLTDLSTRVVFDEVEVLP
jgi:hypothetical protein